MFLPLVRYESRMNRLKNFQQVLNIDECHLLEAAIGLLHIPYHLTAHLIENIRFLMDPSSLKLFYFCFSSLIVQSLFSMDAERYASHQRRQI